MRSVRTAAFLAVVAAGAVPAVASADCPAPVAYAFTGAYDAPYFDGTADDSVVRAYRSPTEPGTRAVVAASDAVPVGPLSTGTSWFLDVNAKVTEFGGEALPEGATVNDTYDASATLSPRSSVRAATHADYLLESQNTLSDNSSDHRWLYLDDASAACGPRGARAEAAGLWVRQADRSFVRVPVPRGAEVYEVDNVPLRAPRTTIENQNSPQYANITVRRVTDADDLIHNGQWRTGPDATAAGWRVDVDSWAGDTAHTTFVLGAAVCDPEG